MNNFYAKFVKIIDIVKEISVNKVSEYGNVIRCGVVPKFSDVEVISLSHTAEAEGIDSENLLFTDWMPSKTNQASRGLSECKSQKMQGWWRI